MPKWIFISLAILGIFQSLFGFSQFIFHKSLGLYFLGESFLSPLNEGLARVFIDGGRLLRAYGTFPHPNVLAAFLVLSLLSIYFLYNKKFFILFPFLIFINWLGLITTFSRAGWIVGLLMTALFLFFNFDKSLFFIILTTLAVLLLIFYWAIFPRVNLDYQNFSIQNRLDDYQLAWQKINEKPWLGHGLTLAMSDRPIHNLYLTVAIEIGLIGLSVFLFFIIYLLTGTWKLAIGNLKLMFIALLLFGFFDHFLWTLPPGLIMFCFIAGLLFTSRVWHKWHYLST